MQINPVLAKQSGGAAQVNGVINMRGGDRKAHPYLILLLSRFRRCIAFLCCGHDSLKLGETVVSPAGARENANTERHTERDAHTHRCRTSKSKKEENGKRSFSGAHKLRVQWPRCEITSGIRTRCSGRETAKKKKDFQWKPKRRGGGGDSREGEGERERVTHLFFKRSVRDSACAQNAWLASDADWVDCN